MYDFLNWLIQFVFWFVVFGASGIAIVFATLNYLIDLDDIFTIETQNKLTYPLGITLGLLLYWLVWG